MRGNHARKQSISSRKHSRYVFGMPAQLYACPCWVCVCLCLQAKDQLDLLCSQQLAVQKYSQQLTRRGEELSVERAQQNEARAELEAQRLSLEEQKVWLQACCGRHACVRCSLCFAGEQQES